MLDRVMLICLAIWAVMFGLTHVTDTKIALGNSIMGFSALILGVVCVIKAVNGPSK